MVPVKHGMSDLMLAIKEAEIKAEAIPLHMHQRHTETQQMKYNNETPILMLHAEYINKTTTPPLPTEEDWNQATSEDHDLIYIKRILSSTEDTPIGPK